MTDVILRIKRYDPEAGGEINWVTYKVPYEEGMTILMALQHAYEQDGLAFRYSCRIGFCGLCDVMVNGRRKLACKEVITNPSQELSIEPVKSLPVIRDLVVNLGD